MHFETRGAGDFPILFVHGGFCDSSDWKYQLSALSKQTRVVAIDLPGHGRTAIDDPSSVSPKFCAEAINGFIAEQGLGPCVLVGHSFGTRVVLETARQNPGNAQAIVLVDTSRVGAAGQPVNAGAIFERIDRLGARSFLRDYFEEMLIGIYSQAIGPEVLERLENVDERLIPAIMLSTVRWDSEYLDEALETIRNKPVLSIQATTNYLGGKRVCITSPDIPWLQLLRERLDRPEIGIVPEAGHFCMLERPETVTDMLAAFARKVALDAGGFRDDP